MCHNHMALKGKSIEWLRNELLYLKKLYHMWPNRDFMSIKEESICLFRIRIIKAV
jgi:hypothetical protein